MNKISALIKIIIACFFCLLLFNNSFANNELLEKRLLFASEMFFQNEDIYGPNRINLTEQQIKELNEYALNTLNIIVKDTLNLDDDTAEQYILKKIYGANGLRDKIAEKIDGMMLAKKGEISEIIERQTILPLNKIIIIAGLFIALLILLKFVFRGSRKIKIIILVLLLLLFAFFIIIYKKRTQHLLNITKNIIFSDYDSKNIYFVKLLKNKEYAEEIIKDINQAKDSIYISMYLIEINKNPYNLSNKIIEALCSAAQRNVKIFVMLDLPAKGENPDLLKKNTVVKKKLESNNIKVIWDSPNNENHEKIVLIDEKIMYIGNHNWSIASLEYNEEISLKITSYRFTADILNYFFNIFAETQENIKELSEVSLLQKELISSDNLKETGAQSTENFAGAAEELENQNIFEREDLIKVTDLQFLPGYMYYFKLRKELAAAESSVYINMFLLRYVNANIKDPVYNLLEILNELNSKGVKIKIVLDRMLEEENKIVYNFLNERKIPVEFYNGNNTMHTKLVVIDGKKIFCGSHNWTNSAFNSNREVSVYLESPEITEQLNINF